MAGRKGDLGMSGSVAGARVSSRITVAFAILATLNTHDRAQQSAPTACLDVPIGCGKGQAMILAEQHSALDDNPSPRETMTDTDVLSYRLDIEISNFNTA